MQSSFIAGRWPRLLGPLLALTVLAGTARARACETDPECDSSEFCDLQTKTCALVPADWCQSHQDCDEFCDKVVRGAEPAPRFGLCEAPPWAACSNASDCAAEHVCRATLRRAGDLGTTCQPPAVECAGNEQCPARFECVQSGPLAATCFPEKSACQTHPDCGLGWACIKFDDDGDTDELLAPPEWGAQSVMNCVPTSWALSSWRSSLPEDAEGDFGADAGDLPIDEGNSQQAPIEPQDGNTAPSSSSPAAATGPAAADADEDTSSEDASESGCSFARASASGAGGAFALFAALLVLRRPRVARKI